MQLDIRIPIGMLFSILGLILVGFGLGPLLGFWGDAAIYERSLGINVNLWWGLVLIAFGGVMLGLASHKKRQQAAK